MIALIIFARKDPREQVGGDRILGAFRDTPAFTPGPGSYKAPSSFKKQSPGLKGSEFAKARPPEG